MNIPPPSWRPSEATVMQSNLTRFADFAHRIYGGPKRTTSVDADWASLWQWSIQHRSDFWSAVGAFSEVIADWGSREAWVDGPGVRGGRWFPDTKLNFAENLLARKDDKVAIIFRDERGYRGEMSFRTLNARVARVARGLQQVGVGVGDVVLGILPNVPEAVIAMLAVTSLGAVWTSCSPDYGADAIVDRMGQVKPKVLFATDGYSYAGKKHDRLGLIAAVAAKVDSISHVVVIPYLNETLSLAHVNNATTIDEFEKDGVLAFTRVPFDTPLFIMFSSGTTGRPKCIVHGAGGTLLQHRKEHLLHVDLRPSDRLFFYTTCGWMMWNWLISALASGTTVLLYEGAPTHPTVDTLWRMADEEAVSVFGTSPKYLDVLQRDNYKANAAFPLKSLRLILSTGAPLAAEQHSYVSESIRDIPIASMSGGTDIISCFCLGNPWLPVRAGELQSAGLGMAVEVWDQEGRPVLEERGELVCTKPFPSMPLCLWGDPDGVQFQATYFERYPGVWHHGDFAVQTKKGSYKILGRSDAVLNPGGVRIGTAEIYRQVARVKEIWDCVAIGQIWNNDVRIVLFVQPCLGASVDPEVIQNIRNTIRAHATPRHVPAKVIVVPDIPRTRNGKIAEIAVRNAVHGYAIENIGALANPSSLDHFRNRTELLE